MNFNFYILIKYLTARRVLFSLTMNMLVKAAEVECRGLLSRSGVRRSPIRAYMDDLTMTTTSVMGGRWLLKGLERNMTWARMYFKPAKSRSLVLKKGNVMEKVRFTVAGETIPTLSGKPIKSLGKTFNSSLDKVGGCREKKGYMVRLLAAGFQRDSIPH